MTEKIIIDATPGLATAFREMAEELGVSEGRALGKAVALLTVALEAKKQNLWVVVFDPITGEPIKQITGF